MERLTYWNEEYGCWSYHCASGDAAKKLATYEDAEEQGRLVVLLCNIGHTVYLYSKYDKGIEAYNVTSISMMEDSEARFYCERKSKGGHKEHERVLCSDMGKTVFLTREAAEAALNKKG